MRIVVRLILSVFACGLYISTMAANRFIIKYKPEEQKSLLSATYSGIEAKRAREQVRLQMTEMLSEECLLALSKAGGVQAKYGHPLATGAHVIVLGENLSTEKTKQFINSVKQDPNVDYIEEDQILHASSVPSINPAQWDMLPRTGDNFVNMWNMFNSSGYDPGANTVIAIMDTGYTPNINFEFNLLRNNQYRIYSYKFISDCRTSGECPADTTDADAKNNPNSKYTPNGLDLGDFVTKQDASNQYFAGCAIKDSSWHGSHVTGIVAANGGYMDDFDWGIDYIAGGAYNAKILPIRVLGKCGGRVSDIINGMIWAAGLSVKNLDGSDITTNENPADVINMSFDNKGPCSQAYQDAIDLVTNAGTIVVAAAGDDSIDVANVQPAGCHNVISVAARGPTGKLTNYSNYGKTTITASGGDENILGPSSKIYSTVWTSTQKYQPIGSGGLEAWTWMQGTSQAAPHVSAAVANLIGVLKARGEKYNFQNIVDMLQKNSVGYENCNVRGNCATNFTLDANKAGNYALTTYSSKPLSYSRILIIASAVGGAALITGITVYILKWCRTADNTILQDNAEQLLENK